MFFIPGFVISAATFPGVMVHEFAHQLFCRFFRVSIFHVCYFQFGNPAGYVLHEKASKPLHQILIGLGPFFVNTILGAVIALPGIIGVIKFGGEQPLDYVLLWLGVSIAMHSFPSTQDASGIWDAIKDENLSWPLKIIFTPFVGLIFVGAIGAFFWLDLIYGIGVANLLSEIIGQMFV